MEPTYTMVGADGMQYGPINLAQVHTWIDEGRITAETKMLRSDTNAWMPAAQFSELGLAVAPVQVQVQRPGVIAATPGAFQPAVPGQNPVLLRRVRVGASWFFVIAVFSLINTFMIRSHGAFFLVGLGVNLMVPSIAASVVVAGVFALFGVFARMGHSWSFIVGLILYTLDALIFLVAQDWLPLAFHAYVIFRLAAGLGACIKLNSNNT